MRKSGKLCSWFIKWGTGGFFIFVIVGTGLLNGTAAMSEKDYKSDRERMVDEQIVQRGIADPRVLTALRAVERHQYMPPAVWHLAYEDYPVDIGHGQTISQPYIVALMTELLQLDADDKVLEIGTGSGYQAAVLAQIAKEVYTVEIVEALGKSAAATFVRLGYRNIQAKVGDGYEGWPEHAPFDAIIVTAAPEHIPEPLIAQLKPGGRMVLPVGPVFSFQYLILVKKNADGTYTEEKLEPVRFVPLKRSL